MDVPRLSAGLSNRAAGWRRRLAPLWQALLPAHCIVCALPSEDGPVCGACQVELPHAAAGCPRCAIGGEAGVACGHCQRHPPGFDWTIARFTYAAPVDQLVQRLKYGHDFAVVQAFSGAILAAVARLDVDLVVPVPLHRHRLRDVADRLRREKPGHALPGPAHAGPFLDAGHRARQPRGRRQEARSDHRLQRHAHPSRTSSH